MNYWKPMTQEEILDRATTGKDLSKLPVWARQALTNLSRDLAYTRKALATAHGLDASEAAGVVDPYGIPRGFLAGTGEAFRVNLYDGPHQTGDYLTMTVNAEHGLEVRGSRSLVVAPVVSNSLVISVVER